MPIWLPKKFERPLSFMPKIKPTGAIEKTGFTDAFCRSAVTRSESGWPNLSANLAPVNKGSYFEFIGGAYVEYLTDFRIDEDFIFSVTFKRPVTGNYWQGMLGFSDGYSSNEGLMLYWTSSTNLNLRITGSNYVISVSSTEMVTLVISNLNGISSVYLDGVLKLTILRSITIGDNTRNCIIGARHDNNGVSYLDANFEGLIESVICYNNISSISAKTLYDNPYQFLVPK